MNIIYTAKDGEVLDNICYQYYGTTLGTVEQVLEANYGLGCQPDVLDAGTKIILPEITQKEQEETVKLWS
ncbi:MAG: phage tail protein X [Rickettsiales bacterium]|jgi:phage tail protein X